MKLGIIGNGFVGKATRLLQNKDISICAYDRNPDLCLPAGLQLQDMLDCDFIFISVPTPMASDGSVYTEIVRQVVDQLRELAFPNFIVVRSTVPPGTCDELGVYFMPEFLTEKNFEKDFITNPTWIYGLLGQSQQDTLFQQKITQLLETCHQHGCIESKQVEFVLNREAEMIKYFRNTFLAIKASYCNEIYQMCQVANINYNKVRAFGASDTRIGLSHTQVPGPDGEFGFGGTCFPKDTQGLLSWITSKGGEASILQATIDRNKTIDRPAQDWNNNKGRSVL
jgi:UDPglucose 6-dehydrogenase